MGKIRAFLKGHSLKYVGRGRGGEMYEFCFMGMNAIMYVIFFGTRVGVATLLPFLLCANSLTLPFLFH